MAADKTVPPPPPPAPKPGIDWANLDLTKHLPVNGHVETRFRLSTQTWTEPTLVTDPNITVSGICPGLNYGQQCYEGLKAYRQTGPDGDSSIAVFRPQFHAARMGRSAAAVCLPPPPEPLLLDCIRMAVAANAEYVPPTESGGFLYIRPVLFGASPGLPLGPCEESVLAVYVHPARAYHGIHGVRGVVCDEFDRAAPRGTGGFKIGGNYAPVWRHAAKAAKMGYQLTLHLDSRTNEFVEEFATSGFLGHRMADDRDVLVVPESKNAIESATSDSLLTLAKREGWTIERKELRFSDLHQLDGVIAVGTAAAAVPVIALDRLGTGEKFQFEGGDQSKLMQLAGIMVDIQKGQREDTEGWCWEVTGFDEY
ncbi:subgroup IIIi aminotransferase [Echria macrotheca]|uniref:Subgroup IIIi aminotransferase n=1 Tax=Echria macrotheca TaxID=438768 RepID=A0AAJ0BBX4_9PEZI|nr:subgroup IIIi aminotransferase [Echria macrotheca]